jgi:NADPH2:quinone reductase
MVLASVPTRSGPGQVLVEAAAAGVNFIDIYRRSGVYPQPVPYVPGSEGAGTVLAVGEGVTEYSAGDHVAWAEGPGSYAEQVAVDARQAVPVPERVDLKAAAAVMLQGLTAHYLCHSTFGVTEGTVLVGHAAGGGGWLGVARMVKGLGGTVIATTSSTQKAALAKQ